MYSYFTELRKEGPEFLKATKMVQFSWPFGMKFLIHNKVFFVQLSVFSVVLCVQP